MSKPFSRAFRATAGSAAVAVLLAAGVAHSMGTRQLERPAGIAGTTAAEDAFPEAPFGVDPMVTGPTTASFKQKQAIAGCDGAIWPNVSLDCYPDR